MLLMLLLMLLLMPMMLLLLPMLLLLMLLLMSMLLPTGNVQRQSKEAKQGGKDAAFTRRPAPVGRLRGSSERRRPPALLPGSGVMPAACRLPPAARRLPCLPPALPARGNSASPNLPHPRPPQHPARQAPRPQRGPRQARHERRPRRTRPARPPTAGAIPPAGAPHAPRAHAQNSHMPPRTKGRQRPYKAVGRRPPPTPGFVV